MASDPDPELKQGSPFLLYDEAGGILTLTQQEALSLELALNKSEYDRKWIKLGDRLYAWFDARKDVSHNYKITTEQLQWLRKTLSKINNATQYQQYRIRVGDTYIYSHPEPVLDSDEKK